MSASPETTKASKAPRSAWRRWSLRALKALLVLVLLIGLAIAWVTQTGHGRKFLIAQVSNILSESVFTGTLHAERIEGPIFGEFTLRNATLTDDEGRETARFDEAYVRYTFTQLLRKRLVITRLKIDGVQMYGRIREDGSLNLANLFVPGDPDKVPPEQGFAVAIQRLELQGRELQIVDERVDELVVGFRDVSMIADFDMDGRGRMHAGISELSSYISFGLSLGREFAARIDDLNVDLDPERISFAAERLTLGETGLFGFDGTIDRSEEPGRPFEYFDARIPQLVFQPEEVEAFVPGLPLATALTIDATIQGPPEDVALRAALSGADQGATAEVKLDVSDGADVGLHGTILVEEFKPELWLSMPGVTGDVNAAIRFVVQGLTPQRLQAGLEINVDPSTLLGYKLDSGIVRLGFAQNVGTLDVLSFRAGSVELSGEGSVSLGGDVDLRVTLDAPDLSDLAESAPDMPPLRGRVHLDAVVKGNVPIESLRGEDLNSVPGIIDSIVRYLNIRVDGSARNVRVGTFALGAADLRVTGRPDDALDVESQLSLRNLRSGSLTVDLADVYAGLRGGAVNLDATATAMGTDATLALSGDWTMERLRLSVNTLSLVHPKVQGSLQQPARVNVVLTETGALDFVTLHNFDFEGPKVLLSVDDLRYRSDGGIAAYLAVDVEDVEGLLSALGVESVEASGALAARGTVHGTIQRPRYELRVEPRGLTVMDIGPLTGKLDVQQLSQRMAIDGIICFDHNGERRYTGEDCSGDTPFLKADAMVLPILPGFRGGMPRFDDRGAFQGQGVIGPLELADITTGIPSLAALNLTGRIALDMQLDGSFEKPVVALILRVEDLWVDVPRPKAARVDGQVIYASDVQDSAPIRVGPIATTLVVKVEEERPGYSVFHWGLGGGGIQLGDETWLRARGDIVAPIQDFLGTDLDPATFLERIQGTPLALEFPDRSFKDLPQGLLPAELGEDGTVRFWVDASRTETFTGVKVRLEGSDIEYADTGPFQVSLTADSSQDTSFVLSLQSLDPFVTISVDGRMGVSLARLIAFDFQPDDPVEARLHIPKLALADIPSKDVRASVREILEAGGEVKSPTIGGYLDLYNTLGALAARGRFHLGDVRTASGATTEAGVEILYDTDEVHELFGGDGSRLQAMVSVCGEGKACAMQLFAAATSPLRSADFIFTDAKGREKALEELFETPYALQLQADDAPLAALVPSFLFNDLATNVDGTLRADLRVGGKGLTLPTARGTLEIEDARGEVLPLARSIDDFDLIMKADDNLITIERLHLSDGGGVVEGTGQIRREPEGFTGAAIDLAFRRFLLADTSGIGVFLTAEVPVSVNLGEESIDVQVDLLDASMVVPDSVLSGSTGGLTALPENVVFSDDRGPLAQYVDFVEELAAVESESKAPGLLTKPIVVNVRSIDDVRVRQRFADLGLSVNMGLALRDGDLSTSGKVSVTSGRARVFGKEFSVALGDVEFDGNGEGPFDPFLRVRAVHELSRKTAANLSPPSGARPTVSVEISSHVSDLEVRLTSDPPLSESNVLNVLLTGNVLDDDSGSRPQALSTAGTLLAGFLTDQIGDNPVIDNLSIELNDSDGTLDSRFEGGRYFGKENSIYASIAYIAGADANENSVEVAWQFILAQLRESSLRLELRWGNRRTGAAEFLYDLRLQRGIKFVR